MPKATSCVAVVVVPAALKAQLSLAVHVIVVPAAIIDPLVLLAVHLVPEIVHFT